MEFNTEIFSQFDKKWALLSAGDKENHNTMTISWGGMGTLWSRPVVTVYVKPIRYTYNFLNENEYFTISFYEDKYKDAMSFMGNNSGRDIDKDKESGLTIKELNKAITYNEAEVTILCKKIYSQDFNIDNMPKEIVDHYYSIEEPHRLYVGQVVDIII